MSSPIRRPIRIRWWIFLYMFLFALMSFVMRTSIPVAANSMMPALRLSQVDIGFLNTALLVTYTIMQIPGGVLGQYFGARRTYVAVGVVALLASLAIPGLSSLFSGSILFWGLLIAQLLMGVACAPVFPMFAAVVEAWFPKTQWAIATGLQSSGMLIGGAVTPLLVVSLTQVVGWRCALVFAALPMGLLTVGWAWYGRSAPREHSAVSPEELAELDSDAGQAANTLSWPRLMRIGANRDVLLLTFSYLCMNYTFYLMTNWSFLYLVQARHFNGIESGMVGMVPWIGAAVGAGVGGYLSDQAVQHWGARWGYRCVPLLSLPIAGLMLLVAIRVSHPYAAAFALAATFGAVELNEGAYWAATMRVARADTGAATGILNTGGNLGGILCQPIAAVLSAAGAWNVAFETGTVLALVAAGAWLLVDADRAPKDWHLARN